MSLTRREFLSLLAAAGLHRGALGAVNGLYEPAPFGNVSLLHFTDCHAQLLPVYYREPDTHIGIGALRDRPPHLTGAALVHHYGLDDPRLIHALTHSDFTEMAQRYGKVGGFAHLATLIKRLRDTRPGALLLDGGDTWQGSATALWTQGQDMVDAALALGVDVMTGHWDFTLGTTRVRHIVEHDFKGELEFVAHNVHDNEWGEAVFPPFAWREVHGVPIAVIGQAYPYTPIANPRHLMPVWRFGIEEAHLQRDIDAARARGAGVVALLSHNGMDIDIKLAGRVRGLDVILGGHTHDAVPQPIMVENAGGKTLVLNSGSHGKFLSVLDLEVKNKRVHDYRYRLLPVFANLLPPDPAMQQLIERVRTPYLKQLREPLAHTEALLYRRGNFDGSFDALILRALLETQDCEIAFSPGFRWGPCLLPGATITREDVMAMTAITYPQVGVQHVTGARIKEILEDVADNLFHKDPYYRQGGDMVRVGGLRYSIRPEADIGQRIAALEHRGKPLMADKTYKVASWANVTQSGEGPAIWDVVENYLKHHGRVPRLEIHQPTVR